MRVTLLGTGSPLPSPDRAGPATLVQCAGETVDAGDTVDTVDVGGGGGPATILVDCGRGVVMRLAAAGVLPVGLSAVLLTHLHSDHLTDLNDVITTRWVMSPPGSAPQPLRIVGPPGTGDVVDAVRAMLALDERYRLAHHADLAGPPAVDVREVAPGDAFDVAGAHVAVHETDHRPVAPTVGYRITDGGGRVAAIAGDTVPCAGLDELCRGADVYVQTVVRADLVRNVPNARLQDILDYHSTVEQAAQTAARAGVSTLVLTHYVPPLTPGAEGGWRALAAAHFDGDVVLGDDLTSVSSR